MFTFSRLFTRFFTGVLLLTLPVGLSNCGSSSNSVEPASLAGNYQITADKVSPAIDFFGARIDDFVVFYKQLAQTNCYTEITYSFGQNGGISATSPSSCTIKDANSTITIPPKLTGTWKLDGDKLTLTDEDKVVNVYALKRSLTGFTMTIQGEEEDANKKKVLYTLTTTFKRVP